MSCVAGSRTTVVLLAAMCAACARSTSISGVQTGTSATQISADAPRRASPAEARFVDSLLALMTVDEKLGQLNQLSGVGEPTGPGAAPAGVEALRAGHVGSFFNVIGADTTRKLQRIAVEQSRLHIPIVFGYDVIHGFRTEFPVPLGQASSWDPNVVERGARIAAIEASAHGLDWTFAPMVDIARDPRWGRIVEGYGEDPFLGSTLAMAAVRGFQGSDLRARDAIAATAKHFAAYGGAEGGRDYNVVDISERTLRDVYLPPYHAAVCAGAATLMASFNEIAGIPSHANHHLLTDILRGEWGFDGMVVSDWTGINELLNHGVAATRGEAGQRAIDAGVDMDMVSEIYLRDLPALVRSGAVSMSVVDEAVRRVLRFKYRLGLFADPYRREDPSREAAATLTPDDRTAERDAARESMVLLRNDGGVLPLRKNLGTIAVIGPLAADSGAMLGNWQAQGRPEDAVPVLDGIRRAVSSGTTVLYARGAGVRDSDTTAIAAAVATARRADVVVLVVGESPDMSAEASSRAFLDLPGVQERLVEEVRAAGKPTVVVLMNGRPLAIDWIQANVPAILEAWFPGIEGGNAIADLLFGDASPSGKLPITFPRSVGQVPIYYAHKNTGRPPTPEKYTSKYIDLPWTPLFPFGFGLSYTTFSYSAPRLSATVLRPGGSLGVDVDVTNSGQRAGDEIVQLYVRDDVGSVTRPVEQLRGFQRISLRPGETRTVHFALNVADLAFRDTAMARVAEPGAFSVRVGSSSDTWQAASFRLETPDGRSVPVPESCAGSAFAPSGRRMQ